MKFNDTLDEHYNEYENIEFVQSEASDTGDEEAEQEQTSGYQKLLDIFVSHIIQKLLGADELDPEAIEEHIQCILQQKEFDIMQANEWNLYKPNCSEYFQVLAEDLHANLISIENSNDLLTE